MKQYAFELGEMRREKRVSLPAPSDAPQEGASVLCPGGMPGIVAFYRLHGDRMLAFVVTGERAGNNFDPANLVEVG